MLQENLSRVQVLRAAVKLLHGPHRTWRPTAIMVLALSTLAHGGLVQCLIRKPVRIACWSRDLTIPFLYGLQSPYSPSLEALRGGLGSLYCGILA